MLYLLLRRPRALRALGLDWKLEKLHSCLASGKLQDFSCSSLCKHPSVSMLWVAQHEGMAPQDIFWAAEHAIPLTSRGGKQEETWCPSLISINCVD